LQYLKSPSSIISTPSDCKSYALFSCGIAEAIKRNTGEDFDVIYRFASYDPFDKVPQHVFCVIRGDGEEFWIDPVLDSFNEKKKPYFFKDKNVNNMSLVGLSGVYPQQNEGLGKTSVTEILEQVFKGAPSIIDSFKGNQQRGATPPPPPYRGQSDNFDSNEGISTNTILLLAAAGLGIYFLVKK
jgi:hypothetical protein